MLIVSSMHGHCLSMIALLFWGQVIPAPPWWVVVPHLRA
jgi:hypothetical protein